MFIPLVYNYVGVCVHTQGVPVGFDCKDKPLLSYHVFTETKWLGAVKTVVLFSIFLRLSFSHSDVLKSVLSYLISICVVRKF